jgi:hypothetical protein
MWFLGTPPILGLFTPTERTPFCVIVCGKACGDEKTSFEKIEKVIGKPLDKAREIKYSKQATETNELSQNKSDFVSASNGP